MTARLRWDDDKVYQEAMKRRDARHHDGRIRIRILPMLLLLALFAGFCYWYTRQSAERQTHIQETTGIYLDRTAKTVGAAMSNVADRVLPENAPDAEAVVTNGASRIRNIDWTKTGQALSNITDRIRDTAGRIGSTTGLGTKTSESPHCYAGMPISRKGSPKKGIRLLKNSAFLVGYSEEMKNPLWTACRLSDADTHKKLLDELGFGIDDRTTARVAPTDIRADGFEPGQLLPVYAVATRHGPEAQAQTFLMSNVTPMKPRLKRKLWPDLMRRTVRKAADRFGEVWVLAGPVFSTSSAKLASGVHIPDACYLILLDEFEGGVRALPFLVSQDVSGRERLWGFLTSVDKIEHVTGLDFFTQLPDDVEDTLESATPRELW